jgi:putative FmdB family regulatory protein
MPIYEYCCVRCGERFEELVSSTRETPPACPKCGAAGAEKLMSAASVKVGGGAAGLGCAPGMGCSPSAGCGPGGFS